MLHVSVDDMALYRFFAKAGMPTRVPSLSEEIKEANTSVKKLQGKNVAERSARPTRYDYTPEEKASIRKYAVETNPPNLIPAKFWYVLWRVIQCLPNYTGARSLDRQ